eukprot:4198875-Amphidinium_carterae.1
MELVVHQQLPKSCNCDFRGSHLVQCVSQSVSRSQGVTTICIARERRGKPHESSESRRRGKL